MGVPMSSVAKRQLQLLFGRLSAIDGNGKFNHDMRGRVFRCKPRHDVVSDGKLAIFISRRVGADQRSTPQDPSDTHSRHTTIWDVMAVAVATTESGDALEDLIEDIERALELPNDLYLQDPGTGRPLLNLPLALIDAEGDLGDAWADFELAVVGVRCVHPHVYGQPDVIT